MLKAPKYTDLMNWLHDVLMFLWSAWYKPHLVAKLKWLTPAFIVDFYRLKLNFSENLDFRLKVGYLGPRIFLNLFSWALDLRAEFIKAQAVEQFVFWQEGPVKPPEAGQQWVAGPEPGAIPVGRVAERVLQKQLQ